jgi:CheY-like chemotaxis protein
MARILVIDDDEALLSSLELLLSAAGHDVTTSGDGLKAAQLFRTEPFDLILTDIVMPNRDGIETVIALRGEFPEIGIIAMSGGAKLSPLYLGIATRLGAHRTLEKPFTPAQLEEAIEAVFREFRT